MKRRELLIGSAAALAAGTAWGKRAGRSKLDRIGIMTLCFDSVLKSASRPADPKRTVDVMAFADMIAQRYGIHRVEFQHLDFPSTDAAYLQEFLGRMKKAASQTSQINLDFANINVSSPDPVIRLETIELTDLGRAKHALLALADAFPALDYYNCDIPPEILFGYDSGLFPTARSKSFGYFSLFSSRKLLAGPSSMSA